MTATPIVPGLYRIAISIVNAFLIREDGGFTLIDTGVAGSEKKILGAVEELGGRPSDLHSILITHFHMDHIGSLAALKKATRAQVYMHPLDAAPYQSGVTMRPVTPAPGLLSSLIASGMPSGSPGGPIEAAPVDVELLGGETLPIAGGLQVIHTPGHTAGHLAFLWPKHGGVLFLGDAAAKFFRLGYSFIYEDLAEGQETLRQLAGLDYEVICFSHGSPILHNGAKQLRKKFATE